MQYQEQKLYTGNPRQLFSVRESRLLGGKMDGVRVADIHNGGNLEVCVAVDRCMDIPEIRYRGRVLNYITPNGIVHPGALPTHRRSSLPCASRNLATDLLRNSPALCARGCWRAFASR